MIVPIGNRGNKRTERELIVKEITDESFAGFKKATGFKEHINQRKR